MPTLTPVPEGAAPWEYRSNRDQRREVHAICDLLRSDLYSRAAMMTGEHKERPSAVWTAPTGWAVEYGYMADGRRIWARIYRPDGQQYAETTDATAEVLDGMIP